MLLYGKMDISTTSESIKMFEELKYYAISSLTGDILSKINIPDE